MTFKNPSAGFVQKQKRRMRERMRFWQARRSDWRGGSFTTRMNQEGRRNVEGRRRKSLIAVAASLSPQITANEKWSASRNQLEKVWNVPKCGIQTVPSLPTLFRIRCSINNIKQFYKAFRKLTMSCDRRPCSGSPWPTSGWQGWWDRNQNRSLLHHWM